MSLLVGNFCKISHIVLLRQLLRRWRKKTAVSSARLITGKPVPSDVPAGHLAVYVGDSHRRFVVRASYLNHPVFQKLLDQAGEVYGFDNHGPLTMPCEESEFEQIVRFVSRGDNNRPVRFGSSVRHFRRMCQVGCRMNNHDVVVESRPLLDCYTDEAVC